LVEDRPLSLSVSGLQALEREIPSKDAWTTSVTIATGVLSMKTVSVLGSKERGEWDNFVSVSPGTTFYHTYEWTEILRIGAGIVPSFWGLWLDGELVVVWPCFVIPAFGGKVLSFYSASTDYAPLVKSGVELECLNDVVRYVLSTAKKQEVLHWSFDAPKQSYFLNIAPKLGFASTPSPRCTFTIDTTLPSEALWEQVDRVIRRAVRRARTRGLEIKASCELDDLTSFLSIYQSTMRRRHLTSLRDPDSLLPLLSQLEKERKAKLFVATDNGKIIAGALLLLHKQRAYGWLAGSQPDSWMLSPNEALIWNQIEWASKLGYSSLDLGGTPSERTHGLHTFKRHFGGEEVELVRFTLPVQHLKDAFCTTLVQTYRKVKQHGLVPGLFTDRVLADGDVWFD